MCTYVSNIVSFTDIDNIMSLPRYCFRLRVPNTVHSTMLLHILDDIQEQIEAEKEAYAADAKDICYQNVMDMDMMSQKKKKRKEVEDNTNQPLPQKRRQRSPARSD